MSEQEKDFDNKETDQFKSADEADNNPEQTPTTPELSSDDKLMAMLCHLLSFAGYVFPFGNIVGPLVIWLMKKDQSEFIDFNGKESINFQISMTIYLIVAGISCFFLIGFLLVPVLCLLWVILVIIATIKSKDGERYTYPLCIRLLK